MHHFEFVIPHKREDLLNSQSGFYSVSELVCIDEVKGSFEHCVDSYNSEGYEFIFNQFDYLYSLLVNFSQCDWPFISKYSTVIYKCITQLPRYVQSVLGSELSTEMQLKARNIVLMNLYIVTQFVICTVDRIGEESTSGVLHKGHSQASKERKTESSLNEFVSRWECNLRFWFVAFTELLQLNLCKLWAQTLIDDAFLNMCATCCYKVLENPSFSHIRLKPLRDDVFQMWGTLIKKYHHGKDCSIKIVQLLFLYSHTAIPLAQAVVLFVSEFGCTSLMTEIAREIELTLPAQDTVKNKSVSAFILEIASSNPKVITSIANDLIRYLQREPYNIMRSCTLTAIVEILMMYSKQAEDHDEETKEQKQLYFSLLEKHMLDNNSFVRSKVLQLWQKMVEAKSVPDDIILSVIKKSLKRIADKNSGVSKSAVRLVTKIFETHSNLTQADDGGQHIVDSMVQLLFETGRSDISEVTHFLMMSYQRKLPGAERGITEMLKLVFAAAEKSTVDAITDVYSKLYLTTITAANGKDRIKQIIKQLCSLVKSLTNVYQCEAMSEIVSSWVKNRSINTKCIQAIWETMKSGNSDTKQTALLLVFMIGSASQNIVKNCVNDLIIYGLMQDSDTGEVQLQTVLFTCRALIVLGNHNGECVRYSANHIIFTELTRVVKEHFLRVTSPVYFLVTKTVMDLIFQLCKTPEVLSELLLLDLHYVLTSSSETSKYDSDRVYAETNSSCLTHFVTLVGYTAYRLVRYYENDFLEALKKQERDKLLNTSNQIDQCQLEADETAIESVRRITEVSILNDAKSSFTKFSIMVVDMCCRPNSYNESRLFIAAAITLSQLMLISSSFCHKHMRLMVALTEKTKHEEIRLWLVVAMGDMLIRFPNVVEPWTSHLFSRLRDSSENVRRITLNTLYRLITNEMLKVKGHISQVALCIIDPVEEISGLARKLFTELSKKDNLLYNVFGDIVSHLSNPDSETPLTEEQFQAIMKFLIEQINKERHIESIVEKICKRLLASTAERQWKDLVYCLSQLPWSERSLCRLLDNANCFMDKLVCPAIAEALSNIANSCNKSTKPALKTAASELSNLIEEVLNRGLQTELGHADDEETVSCNSSKRRILRTPYKKGVNTPSKISNVSSVASLQRGISENVRENSCKSKKGARKRIFVESAAESELSNLNGEVLNGGSQTDSGHANDEESVCCDNLIKQKTLRTQNKKDMSTPSKTPNCKTVSKSAEKNTPARKSDQKHKRSAWEMDISESENEIPDSVDSDVSSIASGMSQDITETIVNQRGEQGREFS